MYGSNRFTGNKMVNVKFVVESLALAETWSVLLLLISSRRKREINENGGKVIHFAHYLVCSFVCH